MLRTMLFTSALVFSMTNTANAQRNAPLNTAEEIAYDLDSVTRRAQDLAQQAQRNGNHVRAQNLRDVLKALALLDANSTRLFSAHFVTARTS